MTDLFSAMIRLQEDALKVQRLQIDAAKAWSSAAADAVKMQRSMMGASDAGLKAWDAALGFWGMKR